ncbi:hypothetical protein M1506_03360 [Patescibacteria group bacterium]|nr:hypothetical protein [Patescibacteria group bacterium]
MKKIEELEKMVLENGTEKMRELVLVTKNYLEGLDKVFNERNVSQIALVEIDFPMFISELAEKGIFKNKSGMNVKIMMMDILFIARNTWELTDKYGRLKTGDDLHETDPMLFDGEKMMDVKSLYEDIKYM